MGLIRTTFEVITEESAQDGEAAESGWLDERGTAYTVHEAIRELRGTEPSSSAFHSGIRYTLDEGQDVRDGSYSLQSYHLVTRGVRRGRWTVNQERKVYEGVTGRSSR